MTLTVETPGSTRCRPRFFTPRDERFPTLGLEVGEVSRRLGRPLMQWQQDLVDVAYEYDPDTGLFRYTETDTTVPRQQGKTTLVLAKKVHRLTKMARRLGEPQRSTYTAQTRLAARKKLERDFAEALRSSRSFREVANAKARPSKATEWRLSLNNGSEAIQFGTGSFLQIDAPSRTGGHGDTLDDGTIDEAFAHEDDTVEGSMRPAMATRANAQLWVISTAGDARSFYLWRKVLAGRKATLAGEHGKVCYVEYSAGDDADPGDPATWWSCMPALGVTITEEFVRGEWERAQRKGTEGINTFCRAYLNMWPEVPILGERDRPSVIPLDIWAGHANPATPRGNELTFGLDVDIDRTASVSAVWHRADGGVQVSVIEPAVDAYLAAQKCKALTDLWGGRVMAPRAFEAELAAAGVPVEVVRPAELNAASGAFVDAVTARTLWHDDDASLNDAVEVAQWASGRTADRSFDLRQGRQIRPLLAAVRALHGLTTETSDDWGMVSVP